MVILYRTSPMTAWLSDNQSNSTCLLRLSLDNRVREIVQAKTGEEYDGAKLMQKAFSADNPIIKLEKGTSQSAHDTQLGYMQIFSGVMTGIRNPKAHEIENITREDALRKLIMLSILMYKLDRATELS